MLLKTIVAIALALSAAAAPLDEDTKHFIEKRRNANCQKVVYGSRQCGHLPTNAVWVPAYGGCYWIAHGRCGGGDDIKDVIGPYSFCYRIQHGRCPGGEDVKWVDALDACATVSACGSYGNFRHIVGY